MGKLIKRFVFDYSYTEIGCTFSFRKRLEEAIEEMNNKKSVWILEPPD